MEQNLTDEYVDSQTDRQVGRETERQADGEQVHRDREGAEYQTQTKRILISTI